MASIGLIGENEAELVEKAKVDDQAFGQLYEYYFPKIYRYIKRRVSTHEIAEDLVSQVFLKAFGHRQNYQSRGFSFGAWLYRIATNILTDHYRRGVHGEVNDEEAIAKEPASENFQAAGEQLTDRAAIEKVLNKMPARYRQVINLRYFAEMEIGEISEVMGLPKTHTSVILHRALNCFKQKSDQHGIKFYFLTF
jgi:RNA polymerase sigma-70 factor, ECF subfamily